MVVRIVMGWGGVKRYFYCTLRWLYKQGAVKGDHGLRRIIATYNLSKYRGLFWAEAASSAIDNLSPFSIPIGALTSNVV